MLNGEEMINGLFYLYRQIHFISENASCLRNLSSVIIRKDRNVRYKFDAKTHRLNGRLSAHSARYTVSIGLLLQTVVDLFIAPHELATSTETRRYCLSHT